MKTYILKEYDIIWLGDKPYIALQITDNLELFEIEETPKNDYYLTKDFESYKVDKKDIKCLNAIKRGLLKNPNLIKDSIVYRKA